MTGAALAQADRGRCTGIDQRGAGRTGSASAVTGTLRIVHDCWPHTEVSILSVMQNIFFCEFDGSRSDRCVVVSVLVDR